MSGKGADALYVALNAALDGLSAFADASVRSVNPHPVLLLHPPSSRPNATNALTDAKARLELFATACQSAGQRLNDIIAKARRSQHDCELALAPISSLPDEVLLQIFELAIAPSSDREKPSSTTVVLLSQVCSAWRNSAREHSGLWSEFFVDQQTSVEVFNQRVERSKAKGLSVTVVDKIPKLPTNTLQVSPCWLENLENLDWHSSSWANASVEIPQNWEDDDSLRDTPVLRNPASFRTLKSLTVSRPGCEHCEGSHWPGDIFFDNFNFPQLKSLVLGHGVDLSFVRTIRAPHLMSLHLVGPDCGDIKVLDALLRSLPTLETLVLGLINAPDQFRHTMTFRLPHLRSLSTRSLPTHAAIQILQSSRFPQLRRWEFSQWQAEAFVPRLAEVLRVFGGACKGLEHVGAKGAWEKLKNVLTPLKPADPPRSVNLAKTKRPLTASSSGSTNSSSAPLLKSLNVSLAFRNSETQTKSDEKTFIGFVQGLLQSRVEGGHPSLEELTLGIRTSDDPRIQAIRGLVGNLTIEPPAYSWYP